MTSLPFNNPIFKKLGFDSTNQWMFYDERLSKFFNWFADNITEENLLSTGEVLKIEDMKERGVYLTGSELCNKTLELEITHPGIFTTSSSDVRRLEAEISAYTEASTAFESLVEETNVAKNSLNVKLSHIETKNCLLTQEEENYREDCLRKAKKLDELQAENRNIVQGAYKRFLKMESPALFMCQMPLEEYARKCDQFECNVEQYVQSHHTFDLLRSDDNKLGMMKNIENLQNSLEHYMLQSKNEIAMLKGTNAMITGMQLKEFHINNVTDLVRETSRLERENEVLESTYDTLKEHLALAVNKYACQQLELVLYENTKMKFERAEQRYNIDKEILNIVNNCMKYAELIWIGTQLDLERWRNLTEHYAAQQACNEIQNIAQRMKIMRQLPEHDESTLFVTRMAEMLSQHLGEEVQPDAKSCLYEYVKIMSVFARNLQDFVSDKPHAKVIASIKEIEQSKQFLKTLVFDGATSKPTVEPVRFLVRTQNARLKLKKMETEQRELRTNYQKNINQRFNENKFWRYSQLLWMWFLTEPERVLFAIEEVKKAAAQTLSHGGRKPVGGIQRKE